MLVPGVEHLERSGKMTSCGLRDRRDGQSRTYFARDISTGIASDFQDGRFGTGTNHVPRIGEEGLV